MLRSIQIMIHSLSITTYFRFSGQTWCQLAYWEECQRVGHLVPVSSSSIEIFSALPKGQDGLCLTSLFKQNKRPSESTTRTREKIGQGKYRYLLLTENIDSHCLSVSKFFNCSPKY